MTRKKNISKYKFIALLIISGIICGASAGAFFALTNDLPQIQALESFKPSATTRIYSADKVLLAELSIEKRDPVPLDSIPEYLKKALIATEDRNFYAHSGVDIKGILRAAIKDIKVRRFAEGASTITQQLAKTLFLTNKKNLLRKLKEAILSFQLERRYTKDEILTIYLNQVYFGSGAYGIKSASRIFFGKQVSDLSIAECALIAGMPKSPSRYSPHVNKELAVRRRNVVLKQMLSTKIIDRQIYDKALKEPLYLMKRSTTIKAPYFIDYIKKEIEASMGSSNLYKGGLSIYTTLSYEIQKTAELSVLKRLSELEKRMENNGIKEPSPQAGLVALNVSSGEILAMIGGKNYFKSPFNRAVSARRQPGSAFKPIVYAHAIERGFPQNKMILDTPIAFKRPGKEELWKPRNFSETYSGEMTLRAALAKSKNIPAVRLIEILGPASVSRFAHNLGIESYLSPYLSLALGTSEVTLIELTSAYSVFPNKGEHIRPFGVTEIIDQRGRIIWHARPAKRIAMSRSGAAVTTNMLEGVIKEGTGRRALSLGFSLGGKTGTTNEYKDALFVGFSPSIATGVWVGNDVFSTLGEKETGARAALPIWIDVMKTAHKNKPYQYFDIPDDVIQIRMDITTGLRATGTSKTFALALFKKTSNAIKNQ